MVNFSKSIRNKRFNVKPTKVVELVIKAKDGTLIPFKVVNTSLNGISGTLVSESNFDRDLFYEDGDLVNEVKLIIEGKDDFGLGRAVIRRITDHVACNIAIQLIDTTSPINTYLADSVEISLEDEDWAKDYELDPEKFNLSHFVEANYDSRDLFEKVKNFSVFYKEWKISDKYGYNTVREASMGPRIKLSRSRKQNRKDYIIMGSNDYLGLASHPEVIEAAKKALDKYGFGATGSPTSTGITDIHEKLDSKLAEMFGREACLIYNSGYNANIGIISATCFPQDLVVADQLCHASIQDGMRMSPATKRFFKHNNMEHLEQVLSTERDKYKGCLLITEGVFSMDGDTPPLNDIHRIARKYDCRLMVDTAHDFGVLGAKGLGACEKYNILNQTDIIMGTFSKICGAIGAFAVADQQVRDWLKYFSRSYIFSVAIPPSTAAAALKSLEIFDEDKSYLQRLQTNIKHFKANLASLGYHLPSEHESSIIPVVIGDEKKLGVMYQSMMADGVYCVPVVYPAVGRSNCRFRFTVMATHTMSDLDLATTVLENAMMKADFRFDQLPVERKKVA